MSERIKICKKHGELPEEHTYLQKVKSGNYIRMCSICKKESRAKWKKLNPEKRTGSQQKSRAARLLELANGTLTKICKRHGNIPVEKIRIDVRGTRVCKLCDAENCKTSKARDPNELADSYVRARVRDFRQGGIKNQQRTYLKGIHIPKELLELKKIQIKLNRQIRKNRKKMK